MFYTLELMKSGCIKMQKPPEYKVAIAEFGLLLVTFTNFVMGMQ
jgi:hypothetical protein